MDRYVGKNYVVFQHFAGDGIEGLKTGFGWYWSRSFKYKDVTGPFPTEDEAFNAAEAASLVSASAEAVEVFGEDELERHAAELKKKR